MARGDRDSVLTSEMEEALRRSGYLMESRVVRKIREHDWFVDANNYIPDPLTGTPRESDLVAERPHMMVEGQFDAYSNIAVIECVNNDHPIVFMSRVPEDRARISQLICMGGRPRTIQVSQGRDDADDGVSIPDMLGLDESHRFFSLPAYDMFCTFAPRKRGTPSEKGPLRAEQPRDLYESFRKLIHVREYYQELHDRNLYRDALYASENPSVRIVHYHHVMIFKGPLVTIEQPDMLIEGGDGAEACESVPHLLYRRSEGNGHGVSGTLVDVITEDYLPRFLGLLEEEGAHFCNILTGKLKQLRPRILPDARMASYVRHVRNRSDK